MNWLKAFFLNFFIVFFADYLLPGIEVLHPTKIPHLGGDFIFAILLGILNSLIYPVLKVTHQTLNIGTISLASTVVSFVAYGILKFAPVGIEIKTLEGYLLASMIVAGGSCITNYLEMKNSSRPPKPPESSGSTPLSF